MPKKTELVPDTTPTAPIDVSPLPVAPSPRQWQRAHVDGSGESMLSVQLLIDGSDADGVRCFNEQLPVSLVRALLDPDVGNFFILIKGSERLKPPRCKAHYLHTGYIREIFLLDDLPPEEGH